MSGTGIAAHLGGWAWLQLSLNAGLQRNVVFNKCAEQQGRAAASHPERYTSHSQYLHTELHGTGPVSA